MSDNKKDVKEDLADTSATPVSAKDTTATDPVTDTKAEAQSVSKSLEATESDSTSALTAAEENEIQQKEINEAADKLEEQVSKAYTASSSWMGGLWNTISKQGSTILQEVGKDFEAVKFEVHEIAKTYETTADKDGNKEASADAKDKLADGETAEKKPTMLSLLTTKAQTYIDNLDKDLEKVENVGAEYFGKVGQDLRALMRETVSVTGPGTGVSTPQSDILFNAPEDVRQQIYSTRFDAQLHSLHTSEEPFTQSDDAEFDKFAKTFDIGNQTDTIAADLEKYPALRKLMEKLVPEQIVYNEFWARYYYMYQQICDQEENRKKLLSQATDGEKEFDWDESDDEDKTKSTASTDASYDVVSRVASDVTLKEKGEDKSGKKESKQTKVKETSKTKAEEPKKETKTEEVKATKPATDAEESDDDWE